MQRAGFGIRLAAALVDAAFLLPVYFLLVRLSRALLDSGLLGSFHPGRADPVYFSLFLGNGLVLAYSYFEVTRAASPGKIVLRLRIVNQDDTPTTRAQLLARYALKHGARICGLVDALTSVRRLRLLYAWAPLAVFRRQPFEFLTLRWIGELLWLFVAVAFFFTLGRSRQSLYDRLTKTVVLRPTTRGPAKQGFEPLPVLPAEPPL